MAACLCAVFTLSAMKQDLGHLPNLMNVLHDHGQTIAEHGHSHDLVGDLFQALQDHAHGIGDHEHVPDLVLTAMDVFAVGLLGQNRIRWLDDAGPPPTFPIERPPRA